jgi:glucose/arabinose dehydrogenase
MSRVHPLVVAASIGVVAIGVLVAVYAVPRVRARQQPSDWFESKNLTLAPVVKGLKEPTYVAGAPDGSNRLFILERAGLVRVADASGQLQPTPFLDLSGQVSLGNEEGLIGFTFHPSFTQNGYVYVAYTAMDYSVQVLRYTVSRDRPDVVDPSTAQVVLEVPKRSKYHNGGMLAFGPDGYLYVSIGDDEASERAQDLGALTGKILRLDVDATVQPYSVPSGNPFKGSDARGEVWAYGLRNPWRFSFDRATGDLWIGDVHHVDAEQGQNWETVQFQPADSPGGLNYGFPMEATFHCADVSTCEPPGVTLPVTHYTHNMNCSITGGYVYRGKSAPGLVGAYIFGDYCTGGVFALRGSAPQAWSSKLELAFSPIKISSFGEDAAGELYVADIQGGTIYRVAGGSLP